MNFTRKYWAVNPSLLRGRSYDQSSRRENKLDTQMPPRLEIPLDLYTGHWQTQDDNKKSKKTWT